MYYQAAAAAAAAAAAKSLQSCPTLCDPIDGRLPGSPIPGILQARTLEHIKMNYISLKNLSTFIEQIIYGRRVGSDYLFPSMVIGVSSFSLTKPCYLERFLNDSLLNLFVF